ncbi:MAG: endonuclease MutS2, partial [Bacteroidales bacterium]|nr:endonuclease MutS2 [Bacteroidales bacterium]
MLRLAKDNGLTESDAEVTVRAGRLVIPVNHSFKRKMPGYILDESSTGKTVYIEPDEVVEINNQLTELEHEERREIVKILTDLTNRVRPFYPELNLLLDALGYLDFVRAKAKLAQKLRANPVLLSNNKDINLQNAYPSKA